MLFALLAAAALVADQNPAPPAVSQPPVAAMAEFEVGKATASDVIKKLGNPNSTEMNSDGTVTIRYMSVHTSVKGASFIPIVGLFAGGAKGKTSTKSFTVGSDGLLKNYASGNTQVECGMVGNCH